MLAKEPYQWSLFLQALKNLQTKGYKPEPASWQEVGQSPMNSIRRSHTLTNVC